MVYVEYNNSKRIKTEKELEYEVGSSIGDAELLAFTPASEYYPSNGFVADGRTIQDIDYTMSFNAIKKYNKKDYCFKYGNQYYKFNEEIKKGDNIYFKEAIDFEILGETSQNGIPTPTKNRPVPVTNKKGIIEEIIGGSTYTFNLGSIELCKIGSYQDKIYKQNGVWYLHKETDVITLNGQENWRYVESTGGDETNCRVSLSIPCLQTSYYSDRFRAGTTYQESRLQTQIGKIILTLNNDLTGIDPTESNSRKVQKMKDWLAQKNTTVYYVKQHATNTEITNATLLAQLNSVDINERLVLESYTNNKVILPVYDELQINMSGSETSFSGVKADFGDRLIEDLPMAYQETRIWEGELLEDNDLSNCELLFTGFLDKAQVTQKHRETDECDIELTLLSPMNLTTRRYVTIAGTYPAEKAFLKIFAPLISDGFEIETIDVPTTSITTKYYMETIETIMNDLSNKLNIFWTINEDKKITVIDINKLFAKEPKLIIESNTEGLHKMLPVIENTNYFNTINIKNARVYSTEQDKNILDIMKLIQDESLEFVNPIDFGTEGAERVCKNNGTSTCTILKIVKSNNTTLYDIKYQNGQIILPSGVVWSDEDTEGATMVLQRDGFFKNLVTGVEWKGATQAIKTIQSDTVLKYQLFRYHDYAEINKCADYITDSGVIEQTIDVNEAWFTYNEIVEYCSNLIIANTNVAGSVELSFDKNYNIKIGDKIKINKPEFFIDGDFIVTEISETIEKEDEYNCEIKAQNNQLQYNYIDIFRKQLTEDEEERYNNINVIDYVEEKIVQKHDQTEVENEN